MATVYQVLLYQRMTTFVMAACRLKALLCMRLMTNSENNPYIHASWRKRSIKPNGPSTIE